MYTDVEQIVAANAIDLTDAVVAALSRAPEAGREGAAERLAIVAEKPAHLIRWGEGDRLDLQSVLAALPRQTALVEQGVEIAAFLVEQDDEPLASDLGTRMNYWRDKCITAGQRLDPKRWGPK